MRVTRRVSSSTAVVSVESSAWSALLLVVTRAVSPKSLFGNHWPDGPGLPDTLIPLMLTRLDLRGFTGDLRARLPRPSADQGTPVAAVREILSDVRARGDVAVRELTERFDGVRLDDLRVPDADLAAAFESIATPVRDALEVAASAIARLPLAANVVLRRAMNATVSSCARCLCPSTALGVTCRVAGRCIPPQCS